MIEMISLPQMSVFAYFIFHILDAFPFGIFPIVCPDYVIDQVDDIQFLRKYFFLFFRRLSSAGPCIRAQKGTGNYSLNDGFNDLRAFLIATNSIQSDQIIHLKLEKRNN